MTEKWSRAVLRGLGSSNAPRLPDNVRQYRVGKTHSGRDMHGHLLGYKTLMKPSKEAIKRHLQDLAKIVRDDRALSQEQLVEHLNPVIGGWANSCRTVVAKRVLEQCDMVLYSMLRRWAQRRHPKKGKGWVARKYWGLDQGEGWTFKAPEGKGLKRHAETPIRRHTKVKGTATPYDGNLMYWAKRLKDHPLTNGKKGFLLRLQEGRCAYCGLSFRDGDILETDHLIPRQLGGDDRLMNLQLLHRHCHDQKTATLDAALRRERTKVSVTKTI